MKYIRHSIFSHKHIYHLAYARYLHIVIIIHTQKRGEVFIHGSFR